MSLYLYKMKHMRKSLPETGQGILALETVLVPSALILLGWPVFQLLVLLGELFLDQAAHSFFLAVFEAAFVDVVVAL